MNFNKLLSVTASAIAFLTFQGAAKAQEAPTPAPSAKEADSDVIIITAEKRSQNLQDVPVAVTAFTSTMRDKVGIESVQDVAAFTPGLSYQTGVDRIYLRGIGRATNNLASDGGTAIYSDGVYTSSTYSAATPSIFVDRIEVLRGPQGTLYGRNAIGGAINIIARRPSDSLTGEVRGEVATFDRYTAEGRISGPISDQLRYSLAGSYYNQGEGYFENASGLRSEGQDGYNTLLEAQLEADFTENLTGWIRYRSSIYDYSPRISASTAPYYNNVIVPPGSLGPSAQWAASSGLALNVVFDGAPVTQNPVITSGNLRRFSTNTYNHQTISDTYDVAGELSWNLGGVNVKYIGGAVRYNYLQIGDFDDTNVASYTIPTTTNPTCTLPGPAVACQTLDGKSISVYGEDKQWWSHELNFSSNNDDSPVQWLGGLYVYKEAYDQPLYFPTSGAAFTAISAPVAGVANPSGRIYSTLVEGTGESYAAFGQVDWSVTDTIKLTGGLRYTHDQKEGTESTRQICYGLAGPFAALCPSLQTHGVFAWAGDATQYLISNTQPAGAKSTPILNPLTGFYARDYEGSWQATTGTLGFQWDPSEDTMVYGKYSRGYKAGGFNVGTLSAAIKTDSELVDAYEIGLKAQPFEGLTTNASLFYYDYKNRQTPLTVVPNTGPTRTEFVNVPESTSQGFELETTWYATDNFRIMANYAYLDAKVSEGCCYIDGVDTLAVTPGANTVTINNGGTPGGGALTEDDSHGQDVAGQQLPNSPKHRATLNGIYTFQLPGGSSLDASASYIWRDKAYAQFFNRAHYLIPSYDQVDLRLTWTDSSEKFRVIAFGRNVLDEDGYDAVTASNRGATATLHRNPIIYQSFSLTPPRTYGVELQAKF